MSLALACTPARTAVAPGEPIPVTVTITNSTGRTVTLVSISLPWVFHHAARFEVLGSDRFPNRITLLDPPTAPDVTVPSGGSVSGEVNLAEYLGSETESINEVPGSYTVVGHVTAVVVDLPPADPAGDRVELTSEPFTVTVT